MHNIGVKDGKKRKKWKKKGKIKTSILTFTQYTWAPSRCIQNLKTLAKIGAEKSVTGISVREKEKWRNKETDKQYLADFLLHCTICHTHRMYHKSSSC